MSYAIAGPGGSTAAPPPAPPPPPLPPPPPPEKRPEPTGEEKTTPLIDRSGADFRPADKKSEPSADDKSTPAIDRSGADFRPERAKAPEPAAAGGGATVGATLDVSPRPGSGATVGVSRDLQSGSTTYSASVRVGAEGGVSFPGGNGKAGRGAGFEASASTGVTASYDLTMPRGSDPLSAGDLARINPFDVASLPPGASASVDFNQFANTSYAANVRALAVSEGVTTEVGVGWQAQRSEDGKTGTTTFGPQAAIGRDLGVGPAVPGVSVEFTSSPSIEAATVVERSYAIADGEAHFTGRSEQSTLDYAAPPGGRIGVGPVSAQLSLPGNTSGSVTTRNADGTTDVATTLNYGGAVPLTVGRTFNADGTEQPDQRTYGYTVRVDANSREFLHAALGGDLATANRSALRDGDTVVLSYDAAQMRHLQEDFAAAHAANPMNPTIGATQDFRLPGLDDQMSFAVGIVRNGPGERNDHLFSETLYSVAAASGATNPGSAWLTNPDTPPERYVPR